MAEYLQNINERTMKEEYCFKGGLEIIGVGWLDNRYRYILSVIYLFTKETEGFGFKYCLGCSIA